MAARGDDLRRIGDFEALCRYLEDALGWPLGEGEYDFDALTFQYEPDELGLKDEYADAIESIHQLRPVVEGQPWGIFFVRFRKKKLPVGVLRRVLSQLALKKRASANKAERAAWAVDDLLFVSAFGDEIRNREIAFAHFHQHGGDLPTLRVIGWDGNDTPLKLDYLQGVLANKLRWPADPTDADAWRALWRSPFRLRPGHVIRKSDELAQELAKLARAIRDRAQAVMKAESAKGPLTRLYDAFKKALIHDLTPEGFADTYAQTITYGLLTAAISRTEMSEGRHGTSLLASDLAEMVPVTNPFLKEMLQTFLEAGGRKGGIDFDELGVQDVVELLRGEDTDLPAILRDFGNRTRGEDPVIHFYEHFLKAYNKQLKVQRGVFYTPQPVVSYIVRSIHELLQTEFGLEDGLADTTTWGEMLRKHPEMKLPLLTDSPGETQTISPDEPFVQILDPATGTATFLVEVIDVIHRTLTAKWKQQRLNETQQRDAWNDYVPRHLLPRLHAFELMMAPYAIAHMKIGLKLTETGYCFGTEERARIYLTNALEPWVKQLPLIGFDALAHEAAAVNEVKRHKRFTVVIGNPPYAGISSNNSDYAIRLVDAYKVVDGEALGEKKLWLQDDYVKFIRLSQMCLNETSVGILGFITNHGFLDNPTFRGMRQSLMRSFPALQILDLHGNANKGEQAPGGGDEQNVFEIRQGVAVTLGVAPIQTHEARVDHSHLWGLRAEKYKWLTEHAVGTTTWARLTPTSPYRFFVPRNQDTLAEYQRFFPLEKVVRDRTVGMITARDALTMHFTRDEVVQTVKRFSSLSVKEARAEFGLGKDARDWSVERAQEDLRTHRLSEKFLRSVLYRPFDVRYTFYTGTSRGFIGQPQKRIMAHLDGNKNWALCISRFNRQKSLGYFFASRTLTDFHLLDTVADSMTVFPLYLSAEVSDQHELSLGGGDQPNFAPEFLVAFSNHLKIAKRQTSGLPSGCTPEDVFHHAYAVFHSPSYRNRYAEFLKVDFPRLPLAGDLQLFRELAQFGGELAALHLLESPRLAQPLTEFIGGRNPMVEKVSWSHDTVWVDKAQTTGFRGVREEVWNFHIGGYQVCEKWLKDRKGRALSKDDIAHYHKIVIALSETIRLMTEIDRVIDQHGGWPGAFATSTAAEEGGGEPEPPAQAPRAATERAPKKQQASNDLFGSASVPQAPASQPDEADTPRADLDDTDAVCAAIRQHLSNSQTRSRDDAITTLARALGYQRTGSIIREALDKAIRTAVRRGILKNEGGGLSLRYRTLEQHVEDDRDGLKTQFLAALDGRAWIDREDAVVAFTRWMGFRRTGSKIEEVAASLINGLLREGRLEKDGNQIRRIG